MPWHLSTVLDSFRATTIEVATVQLCITLPKMSIRMSKSKCMYTCLYTCLYTYYSMSIHMSTHRYDDACAQYEEAATRMRTERCDAEHPLFRRACALFFFAPWPKADPNRLPLKLSPKCVVVRCRLERIGAQGPTQFFVGILRNVGGKGEHPRSGGLWLGHMDALRLRAAEATGPGSLALREELTEGGLAS